MARAGDLREEGLRSFSIERQGCVSLLVYASVLVVRCREDYVCKAARISRNCVRCRNSLVRCRLVAAVLSFVNFVQGEPTVTVHQKGAFFKFFGALLPACSSSLCLTRVALIVLKQRRWAAVAASCC